MMTTPEPTPDTATLADRIEDTLADTLPVMTDPENAGQTVLHYGTEPGDMEWGAAATLAARLMDAIRPLITHALAAAEQQTAELTQELARAFVIHCDKLLETTANGDAPDFSQIQLGDLDTATPDELRAEIRRLDHRLRWAYRHNDDNQTASLLGLFEIRKQREEDRAQVDAARAEVAELTQQRDQARGEWRREMAQQLNAEATRRSNLGGDPGITRGYRYAALHVLHADDVAVPVPAGDTQTPEVPPGFDLGLADLARVSVAEARRTAGPTQSEFIVALKIMREKVHKQGGDHSLLRLKPYVEWAMPATPAAAGDDTAGDQR